MGVLHLVSALLYAYSWKEFSFIHIIMIPEYMNMIEASLYITSASMYNEENAYYYTTDPVTLDVHYIEMTGTSPTRPSLPPLHQPLILICFSF